MKETLPCRWSDFVTKAFLGRCRNAGSGRTQSRRVNGEGIVWD